MKFDLQLDSEQNVNLDFEFDDNEQVITLDLSQLDFRNNKTQKKITQNICEVIYRCYLQVEVIIYARRGGEPNHVQYDEVQRFTPR